MVAEGLPKALLRKGMLTESMQLPFCSVLFAETFQKSFKRGEDTKAIENLNINCGMNQ